MEQEQEREFVVLIDEKNNIIGTMLKSEVHGRETPLHRAFSTFIFRKSDKKLLLQQRSHVKKTWPLMWSNSCCGHPKPNEDTVSAAKRRLDFELGLQPLWIEEVAPYQYCFTHKGVMENEICPILIGMVDSEPIINTEEVEAVMWVDWNWFVEETKKHPEKYSEWCVEEVAILDKLSRVNELFIS
ncbi:MAG: isopentenyl-diphosphate Delta-isomerase [Candidatus Moraniibacteriota bacterium]|nr:MAG: isopentenyl-diphosphate Delta-isomerase [Candidatus Moranbacteria bacterium]